MMVIREALRHHGKTMKINIGQQIALSSFKEYNKDLSAAANVCLTHFQSIAKNGPAMLDTIAPQELEPGKEELISAIEECEILRQFEDGRKLVIYRCNTNRTSPIIDELGRLRERCYRDIGAGTGNDRDNDVLMKVIIISFCGILLMWKSWEHIVLCPLASNWPNMV